MMDLHRSDASLQWVDSHVTVFQDLWPELRRLKDSTPVDVIRRFADKIPILEHVEFFEAKTGPVDWEHLDAWIDGAIKALRAELMQVFEACRTLRVDLPDCTAADVDDDKLKAQIEESPLMKLNHRLLGPNLCQRQSERMRYVGQSDDCIPRAPDQFQADLDKRTSAIMRAWNRLRVERQAGTLAECQARWARCGPSQRRDSLKALGLSEHPNSDLYAWVRHAKHENLRPKPSVFMSPLLNVEAICRDNVLPELLECRAKLHPGLFLTIDGRSTGLGIWSGFLPQLRVPGVVKFSFEDEPGGQGYYGALLDHSVQGIRGFVPSNFRELLPGLALQQLEAQRRTYDSLSSLPRFLLEQLPASEVTKPVSCISTISQPPSLLGRASLSDYSGSYKNVDLRYLDSLLKAALDEALDDLTQMRMYSETWMDGLKRTSPSSSGRISTFCRNLFGRIDTFHTLGRHLDSFKERREFGTLELPGDDPSFRAMVAFHTALLSMRDDVLCRLQGRSWSADKCGNDVVSVLYSMLRSNDSTLRVMSLLHVMMVIDREVKSRGSKTVIPRDIVQLLNDLSILAACLRETEKHYRFAEQFGSYAQMSNEVDEVERLRERPWLSAAEATLAALDADTKRKLNTHVHDEGIPVDVRHYNFWRAVDGAMRRASPAQAGPGAGTIFNSIQRMAPINKLVQREQPTAANLFYSLGDRKEVSETRLKLSKRRNRRPQTQPVAYTTTSASLVPSLPVIELRNHKQFWSALLAPSIDNKSEFTWQDFCKAMGGIGYEIHPQLGSAHRFQCEDRPGAIVFHKPHESKVSRVFARREWLDRLQRHFTLRLQ